jgi:eukaryotic-like serine/threonine-protein kinase
MTTPGRFAPTLPVRVGRYTLLVPLGAGGMGAVYLARMHAIGGFERDVAVKLLHGHLQDDEAFVSAFLREARLAANIRHPNVVPVLDVVQSEAGVLMAMEYVPGASLAELRRAAAKRNEILSPAIGLRVLLDALDGLHAAHEQKDEQCVPLGIVHRDFSPHNILVGVDGRGHLLDFGIAKVSRASLQTDTGIIKGKLPYMAPEQARGAGVDRRTDVWAAGVLAWEILAGRRMHRDGGEAAILMKIVGEEAPRLDEVCPELPPDIVGAVHSALERDLDRRCPDAATFRQRLAEVCAASLPLSSPAEVAAELLRLAHPQLNAIEAQSSDARRAIAGGNIPESRSKKETNTITSSVRRGPDPFDETIDAVRVPKHRSRVPWIAAAALLGGAIAYGVFSGGDDRVVAPSPRLTLPTERTPKPAPAPNEVPSPVTGAAPSETQVAPAPRPRKFRKENAPEPAAAGATPVPTAVPIPPPPPPPPPPRPTLTDNPY